MSMKLSTFAPVFASIHILRRHFFCQLAILLATLVPANSSAQEEELAFLNAQLTDSATLADMEISLVTCEPFNKIYSLYGHTGLHIRTTKPGLDLLANWGIFDMRMSFFALRFALGLTDYRMEIETWEYFCYRYHHYGSGVFEQKLALTQEEKLRLVTLVLDNYKPENRYYRYNFFFDNCTTRARDIVEECLCGNISCRGHEKKLSFRDLIHEWNDTHLWARWGNDILLGVNADRKATDKEAQFLPDNLRKDFDNAVVNDDEGERKLVYDTRWAVFPMYDKGSNSFADEVLLSPTGATMAYFIILIVVCLTEWKRRKRLWLFDATVLLTTGMLGLLLFVMIFSQHPAVSLNAQILIFNPLALVFLRPVVKSLRHGKRSKHLTALATMAGLGIVCGITLQHFAEGMMTLALFLIFTYMRRSDFTTNETR